MKRQFELIEKIYESSKKTEERIRVLREEIQKEQNAIKRSLIDLYDHEADVLYLIDFQDYSMSFYKATKEHKVEVYLSWFNSKVKVKKPKSYEEAFDLLNNLPNPSNSEIRSYDSFGYFDDIKARYDRIDWIVEQTSEKRFLYDITKETFIKSLELTVDLHSK